MFALVRHDPRQKIATRSHKLRAIRKQDASHDHGQQELDRSHAGVAGKSKQSRRERLEIGHHLAQQRAKICRGLIPEFEKLRSDQGPILDRSRRRRNQHVTRRDLPGNIPDPIDGTHAEPGRGPDDNGETDEGEDHCRKLRPAPEDHGEALEHRIERDGEHDAPGQDRHERTDQKQRPDDQNRKQPQPNQKLDNFVSGDDLPKCSHGRAFNHGHACCRQT